MSEDNVEIVRASWDAWARGDTAALFEFYDPDAEEFVDAGENVIVRVRQGGRGRESTVEVEMPMYWQVYRLRDGRAVRVEIYREEADALEAVGLRKPPDAG
jgi:ketosteroid isomerase-like protein